MTQKILIKHTQKDPRIIYIETPCPVLKKEEFEAFEKRLKSSGFQYYSAFLSIANLEEMYKLNTKFWCVSLDKRSFVRMHEMTEYVPITTEKFMKMYIGILDAHKYGL